MLKNMKLNAGIIFIHIQNSLLLRVLRYKRHTQ